MTSYDYRPSIAPWTDKHKMAIPVNMDGILSCDNVSTSKYEKLRSDDMLRKTKFYPDELDDPNIKRKPETSASEKDEESERMGQLFDIMKYEVNRLNSFNGNWPLNFVKPAELSKSGFFYLQTEDEVQCAFCRVIVKEWKMGDKPLKEHMRMYPKCPFLLRCRVGNVPVDYVKPAPPASKCIQNEVRLNSSSSYKPKHPRMADIKNRLATYKDWPLIMLNSKQLAECGLYYTGVADVVTCFFCGGSLGNWELNDDPWVEHNKFFPNCAYLGLVKRRSNRKPVAVPQSSVSTSPVQHQSNSAALPSSTSPSSSLQSEVIQQASEIFPRSLVQKVVTQRLKVSSHPFTSLNELCEAILEYKETEPGINVLNTEKAPDIVCQDPPPSKSGGAENSKDIKDVLLCKICMDREKGIVFMPCGHLISCPQCAQLIFNCPVCRSPVTNKVRTYLS